MIKIYEVVPLAYAIRQIHNSPEFCGQDTLVFLDVETDGLYGDIMLATFMLSSWEVALLVERPDSDVLKKFVNSVTIVAHAVSYELSCIKTIPERFHCTHMASKLHFFREEKFTLDAVYGYALNFDPYVEANLDKKVMQKTNWSGELTDMHYLYAAIDVYYMPELWDTLKGVVTDSNYVLDILTIKHCQKMEIKGLPLKPLKSLLADTIYELNTLESKLPVNPRSAPQVAKYLNMPNGTGADKLAKVISLQDGRAENAQMVRTARELSTYKNTFVTKMVGHSRWYGHFAPRTKSGRLASSDNNLQNLPRKMKPYIGYDSHSERVLVSVDYAQLELRTIAAITGDTKMVELFQQGVDVHGYVAEMLFGSGYTKEQRQIAKTANFSLLYGASATTFAAMLLKDANIILTESEAMMVKKKWLNTWRGVASWQQTAIKSWRAGNYWFTPMGRRYKAKLMTDFMSIRNQGAGAEVSKLGFNFIMKDLYKANLEDTHMVDFVHDSFLVDCPNDPTIYEKVAEIFVGGLRNSWLEYGKVVATRGIPMPVDCGVAFTWADADGMTDECLFKIEVTE